MAPVCVEEFEALARAKMPRDVWDFFCGGNGAETSLHANRAAFDALRLRPRVLVDVSMCDPGSALLGTTLKVPFGVAPMAYHRLAHHEGELATARGAGSVGAFTVVSVFASQRFEDIARHASAPLWLQTYWFRDRSVMTDVIGRAQAAGYRALVLSVDMPRMGRRLRDMRNGFTVDPEVRAVNVDAAFMAASHRREAGASALASHTAQALDPSITWDDLAWLRQSTSMPLVLKGILTADDAELALLHGAQAIVVSNHGGRQLDGAISALEALPEIVDAVQGRVPVLMDGGIRRGTDVLKALALGAQAVLVGRPVLWGLAAAGEHGVAQVLSLLRDELENAMALAGAPTLAAMGRSLLNRR